MEKRNYTEAAYKKFRYAVLKRDGAKCKWPNCPNRKKIHVHHIMPWKQFPHLRYKADNGICLCKLHHEMVTGHEITYAKFLSSLI